MEMYLAVIKVLESGETMAQKQIMRKAGIHLDLTKEFFDFLVNLDIINEETFGSKVMYSITHKGQRLSVYFGLNDNNSIFNGTGIFRID